MNQMNRNLMLSTTLAALLAALLSSCASQPPAPVAVEDRPLPKPVEKAPEPAAKPAAINPLKDPKNILSKRSVFFDFDKFDVKTEYTPLVKAHADYLRANAAAKVTLQGNADERGSREYNLALGQRRADSVGTMMKLTGAKESQMETVSFGEEKPRATGHDEAAWSQNRRTDILYQGE